MDRCNFTFNHERLEVYRVAVQTAGTIRRAAWPRRTAHIKDQAVRSSESMVLARGAGAERRRAKRGPEGRSLDGPDNIAEGVARGPGDARKNHHLIAFGSAAETLAALDVVDLHDKDEIDQLLRRIGAMLCRMTR